MKVRMLLMGLLVVVLAAPLSAAPVKKVLQIDPASLQKAAAAQGADIGVCTYLHEIYPSYCQIWHVIAVYEVDASVQGRTRSQVGSRLTLQNAAGVKERYQIDRMVPHYRLDNGGTFEPAKSWNPRNADRERWVEVRADQAKRANSRVVTDWQDVNGDGLVGVYDSVVFDDGEAAEITGVAIGVHVTRVK